MPNSRNSTSRSRSKSSPRKASSKSPRKASSKSSPRKSSSKSSPRKSSSKSSPRKARNMKQKKMHLDNISDGSIRRIAHKAGVTSIGPDAIDKVKVLVDEKFVRPVISDSISLMIGDNRSKFSSSDALYAVERNFKKVYSSAAEDKLKKCKTNSKTNNKYKYYQKLSDCVFISKAGFDRYVREMIESEYISSISQISPRAIGIIHQVCEQYMYELLLKANLCALHAKRSSVSVKDIDLVYKLMF